MSSQGLQWHSYPVLDSTNEEAKRLLSQGFGHGTVVEALEQTKGKGRKGRTWISGKGEGLYFTLIVEPQETGQMAAGLTVVMAMAVCRALEEIIPFYKIQVKWPNDLIINRKKVCGILAELILEGSQIQGVVLGVGINLLQETFEEELKDKATSLYMETKQVPNLSLLKEAIGRYWIEYYEKYQQRKDLAFLREEYQERLVNLGEKVKVLDPKGEYEGIARGITKEGYLIVDTEGQLQYVSSGEVSVRGVYGYV